MTLSFDHSRVFTDGGSRFTVVRASDAAEGRPLGEHEGRWALARALGPGRGAEIVGAYRALLRGPLPFGHQTDVDRMREALLDAVDRGYIRVFEVVLAGTSVRREDTEDEASAPPPAAPREDKTWVGIVLVDDSDPPEPVAFARYRIELPDGSTREGILDQNGKARIAGIDPGSCKISFPSFDRRDWS